MQKNQFQKKWGVYLNVAYAANNLGSEAPPRGTAYSASVMKWKRITCKFL